MRYLVTGGAGFIGSHLTSELLSRGDQVIVYDNFSSGNLKNLMEPDALSDGSLQIINGDIRDVENLKLAMDGVDGVFHLAALVSVPESIDNPALSFDINTRGTHFVLNEARKAGVARVVVASSAAVYGANQNFPLKESEIADPLSPYGLEKLNGEQMGELYSKLYGLNVTCLRFFNVFGPKQPPSSPYSGVVSIFSKKATLGVPPIIFGDGSQTRDFVFVKDVAQALILSMCSSLSGFRVYNVGSGTRMSVAELWNAFEKIAELQISPIYHAGRPGEIKHSVASIEKICEELKFVPLSDFITDLSETYKWSVEFSES